MNPCRLVVQLVAPVRRAVRHVVRGMGRRARRNVLAVAIAGACGAGAVGIASSLAAADAGNVHFLAPPLYAPGINAGAGDLPGYTSDTDVRVPEPQSLALLGAGLVLLGLARWRA